MAWPWLIALLVFGMPHGGADWKVHRADRQSRGRASGLLSFVPYLLWMVGASLALYALPLWTIAAFFVLTAVHFGMADATHALGPIRKRSTWPADDPSALRWTWWAVAWSRGGLVLTVPFSVDPSGAWWPFAALSGTALDALPISAEALRLWSIVGSVALIGLGTAGVASIPRPAWRQPRTWFYGESCAALLLLVFTHPLFSVGVYFLCVHAPKHTLRLAGLTAWLRNPAQAESNPTRFLLRVRPVDILSVHRGAIALWPLSVAVIVGWASCISGGLTTGTIAIASIGFYIVTTLPHHLLGNRLPD